MLFLTGKKHISVAGPNGDSVLPSSSDGIAAYHPPKRIQSHGPGFLVDGGHRGTLDSGKVNYIPNEEYMWQVEREKKEQLEMEQRELRERELRHRQEQEARRRDAAAQQTESFSHSSQSGSSVSPPPAVVFNRSVSLQNPLTNSHEGNTGTVCTLSRIILLHTSLLVCPLAIYNQIISSVKERK